MQPIDAVTNWLELQGTCMAAYRINSTNQYIPAIDSNICKTQCGISGGASYGEKVPLLRNVG